MRSAAYRNSVWLLFAASALPAASPAAPAPAPTQAAQPRAIGLLDTAIAFLPSSVTPQSKTAPPVLVLLHGAGRDVQGMIKKFAPEAEARGIVLLAPAAAGMTWDVIRRVQRMPMRESSGKLDGPYVFRGTRDSARIEAAIAELKKHVAVDRSRTVLAGFSDGATFALTLGLSQDHQFASVMGFSPGYAIPALHQATDRPVLVAHGRDDQVIPFTETCNSILPTLRSLRADVTFRPFDGRHQIPAEVMTEFLDRAFGPRPGLTPRPIAADHSECTRGRPLPLEIPKA